MGLKLVLHWVLVLLRRRLWRHLVVLRLLRLVVLL